ncbi:MAG: DUF2087 domain-containing protein [Betaproteobacteria bacterium]
MSEISRFQKLALKRGLTPGALLDANPPDFDILLLSIRRGFSAGENYTERAVNELLKSWLAGPGGMLDVDHVELRRWMADLQILSRDVYGQAYLLAPIPARLQLLDAMLADVDFASEFAKANEQELQRRAARKAAWQQSKAGA